MLTSFSCKVHTIVCDNALNNDTMIVALDLEGCQGAECCIWCFPHILNLAVKVWCSYIPTFSWFSQGMKAILLQFSHKLEDEEVQPTLVPTSRKKHPAAKHQAHSQSAATSSTCATSRQTHNTDRDSDDDDSCSSCGSIDDNDSDIDALDQDEDVILAAEMAQQADLVEAKQSAELELVLTDSEWNVASMALAKVSSNSCPQMKSLLITPNSLLSLPTGSTTHQVSLRRLKSCAKLQSSSLYA
jgi:hypothetical protein